jgi:hypothetical protein
MATRQNITAIEWRVTIRNSMGISMTLGYYRTKEAAEATRAHYDVISIELTSRVLDF